MDKNLKVSFIEPYPDTLHKILKKKDIYKLEECNLQEIDLSYFGQLETGDIFYPFEYPYEWIKREGWVWNEIYLIRAFLMNNKNYKIKFFVDYLVKKHKNKVEEYLHINNLSGGSLWLEKV